MKKPDSTDKGISTDLTCYVSTGTTKEQKEACAWTGSSNKEITVTTTDRIISVRAQVEITGTGCFSKVTAYDGTVKKDERTGGFNIP
jgi:hypothetical protein